jgi:hypothetical protein
MSGFKMKGSPMQRNFGVGASPVKHGDGSWGGTDEAPVVENVMEKKAQARQTKKVPQPPPRTEFHTDKTYALTLAKWKRDNGIE